MSEFTKLPQENLPFNRKTAKWRKQHLDWAESNAVINDSVVRKSVKHKKINYDLLNGIIHMDDLEALINPDNLIASFVPDSIQHFSIMNSKLNVLRGEELSRLFDFRAIVTNPTAISEIETAKKDALLQTMTQAIENQQLSEDEYMKEMEKISKYYSYEWQDIKEVTANCLLNHYIKEYNLPIIFNAGFMDALTVGEEIYQVDIVGGEPVVERLNPCKVRVYKSGYSNRIEDADIIVIEDWWSPGRIIDTYYDVLSQKDIKRIENIWGSDSDDERDKINIDERQAFVNSHMIGEEFYDGMDNPMAYFDNAPEYDNMPYDFAGNIRVIKMYWKSRRKVKKVKSYDPTTGEEVFNFYPENYVINEWLGEEEQNLWINEAWEGVKIGQDIYVNMRPRPVQFNRMSNPSRCHFGIIGSIYNLNDSKPYSLVDAMKKFNYMYDILWEKARHLISVNMGKLTKLDFAMVPKGWDIEKWMYFAKTSGIAVSDSFKEGNAGAAMGKLAGGLNNNTTGVIDAELGNSIQQCLNLMEFAKMEMAEIVGISKQREGQISNRETVGGVERATLQSSHITEWLFATHDDVKKRVMECLLESAKIAYQGRIKKFQYVLPDNSMKAMEIDGEQFSEMDFGIVVDNSPATQQLNQHLETLAQAALQNQLLSFSTIMKLYSTVSLAEKQRMVENEENEKLQMAQEAQQAEQQRLEQEIQIKAELENAKLEQAETFNVRDNDTKITVAQINSVAEAQRFAMMNHDNEEANALEKERLMQSMKKIDADIKLGMEKLKLDKEKHNDDVAIKKRQLNSKKQ